MSKGFEINSVKDAELLISLDRCAKLYGCEGVSAKYDEMIVNLRETVVNLFEEIWTSEDES